MSDARDVIARALFAWGGSGQCVDDMLADIAQQQADAILVALADAGLAVVPREPTEAMLDAYWRQAGESKEMRSRTHHSARAYFAAMIAAAEGRRDG